MERVASIPEELPELERQSQMKNLQEEQKMKTRQLIKELSLVWVSEHWDKLGI